MNLLIPYFVIPVEKHNVSSFNAIASMFYFPASRHSSDGMDSDG